MAQPRRAIAHTVPPGHLMLIYITEASEKPCICSVEVDGGTVTASKLVEALWADHAPLRKFPVVRYSCSLLEGRLHQFCLLKRDDSLAVRGLDILSVCLYGEGGGLTWVEKYLQKQSTLKPFDENAPCPALFGPGVREEALNRLRAALSFVPRPFEILLARLSQANWNRPCNNMVLHGPPGTGKSRQVKALFKVLVDILPEGRVHQLFLEPASALNDKYFGESEKRIRSWGQNAAEHPENLYLVGLEEVHTLAKKQQASKGGEEGGADATANMITMLLHLAQEYHNILFVSTTNFVEALDEAFMRADRVEFSLLVPISTQAERRAQLRQVDFLDVDVVGLTANFSFAQLATLKRKWNELRVQNEQALHGIISELGERETETRSTTRRLLSLTGVREHDMTRLVVRENPATRLADTRDWEEGRHHALFPTRGALVSFSNQERRVKNQDAWRNEGWLGSIFKTSAPSANAIYVIDGEFHLNYGGERAWPALKRILDQCVALTNCIVVVEWEAAIGLHFSSIATTPRPGGGAGDASNTLSVSDSLIFDALTTFIVQSQQVEANKRLRVLEVFWSKEHHVLNTMCERTGVRFNPNTNLVEA